MTTQYAIGHRNPFSTACVRPGQLPYFFPEGTTGADLIQRLAQFEWRGQIIGPHGSGKTTLLHSLLPLLRLQRQVNWFRLHADHRRLLVSRSDRLLWSNQTLVVVDGFEHLSRWQRARLRTRCRWRRCGLLVTAHADTGLPTILATSTSDEMMDRLVELLLANSDSYVERTQLRAAFQACQGNVRETLFKLYDLYESQQLSRL